MNQMMVFHILYFTTPFWIYVNSVYFCIHILKTYLVPYALSRLGNAKENETQFLTLRNSEFRLEFEPPNFSYF